MLRNKKFQQLREIVGNEVTCLKRRVMIGIDRRLYQGKQ